MIRSRSRSACQLADTAILAERRRKLRKKSEEMARKVGRVSFWAGVDRHPGPGSADWLRDGVRRACAAIRDEGLVPSFEPEPGMAVETVRDFRRLCEDLGPDAPALTLDVGHLYAVWEGDPVEVVRAAVPHLAQVHLEDHRRGVHEHLLPGDGEVAFPDILSALEEESYGGPVCFELSRHSHMGPTAVARCAELWRASGAPDRR